MLFASAGSTTGIEQPLQGNLSPVHALRERRRLPTRLGRRPHAASGPHGLTVAGSAPVDSCRARICSMSVRVVGSCSSSA